MVRTLVALGLATLAAAPAAALPPESVLMAEDPEYRAMQEKYGFSDAVIVGDMIYLSGVVAGFAPGETDMVPAYDRAFRHIGKILARAGASWADVVDVTTFHTDVKAQLDAMNTARARYMKAPYPAWTAIGVSRLLPDTGLTEIKVIARKPAKP